MSYFSALFRDLKKNWLYASILSIVLGIVLLAFPGIVMRTIGYLIAALFVLIGATRIIAYVRGRGASYGGGLLLGLAALPLGILIFARVDAFVGFLPFVIGIVTIFTAAGGVQTALDLRGAGYSGWIGSLLLSILSAIIGVLLIINPFGSLVITVMVIGISLICDGVSDLLTAWQFDRKIKK